MKKFLWLFVVCLMACTSPNNQLARLAKENNCMTETEFLKLWYSYNYEDNLPCLVLVDKISVEDLISRLDVYAADSVDWVGEPSHRNNTAWIKSFYPHYYIGLTQQQTEWFKSLDVQYYINKKIVIKIYQVENGKSAPMKCFMADMKKVLEE